MKITLLVEQIKLAGGPYVAEEKKYYVYSLAIVLNVQSQTDLKYLD